MATFTQSWAWVTNKGTTPNNPENLVGYEFDPYDTYKENAFSFRDFDEDGFIDAQNQTAGGDDTPPNDGVLIDGIGYQISHHWAFNATVKYKDGTELTNQNIIVMRLIDNNGGAAEHHNDLIFRIHDANIDTYFEGEDGPGGKTYAMIEIEKIIITSYEADQPVNQRNVTGALDDPYPKIVCFSKGTLIETDRGQVAVEDLNIGDMVRTLDHGFQPVYWIGSNKITRGQLSANPKLCPVRILAGVFGSGLPARDLLVTRQHRILVRSSVFMDELDVPEVLVPAKDLIVLDGVDILDDYNADITYYHILCEAHEILYAEGLLAESMLTGTEALKALNDTAREEISILIPELQNVGYVPTPARMLFAGKRTRNAIKRHTKQQAIALQSYYEAFL